MPPSSRSQVDPFIVMDVMEAARAAEADGRRIIHMEVGQPGTPAPKAAREAVAHAMTTDPLGYTVALGLPALREGIAQLYQDWYGVDLDPARVVVTSGSSAAFLLAFTALFDAGDRVGIPCPGYPSYWQILKALSLSPVSLPTALEDGHQLQIGDIDRTKMEGLMVASPNNPTGTMVDFDQLKAIAAATSSQGISLISDEIYHGIEYGKKAVTALQVTQDAFVINSFSKYFSMTGWRVGWMVVPENYVRTIERLAQNMFICPPHVSQVAALAALSAKEECAANLAVYSKNRDLMIAGLAQAGFTKIAPPDGAFYIYADVSDLGVDSRELAADILEVAGVAVTPGLDFDKARGAATLRFSYARAREDIEEGLARLTQYMMDRSE